MHLQGWLQSPVCAVQGSGLVPWHHSDAYNPHRGASPLMLLAPCVAVMPRGWMSDGQFPWLLNSALAVASLSGGRRARACTVGPLVVMKCSTPCLVEGWVKMGTVMSGNSTSSMS